MTISDSKRAAALTIEYLALDTLTVDPQNARRHSKKQIERLAAVIREFGFTNPILIDEDGFIIAGHARLMGFTGNCLRSIRMQLNWSVGTNEGTSWKSALIPLIGSAAPGPPPTVESFSGSEIPVPRSAKLRLFRVANGVGGRPSKP